MTPAELRRRIEALEAAPLPPSPEEIALAATIRSLDDEALDRLIRETLAEYEVSPEAQAFATHLTGLSDQELEASFATTRSGRG